MRTGIKVAVNKSRYQFLSYTTPHPCINSPQPSLSLFKMICKEGKMGWQWSGSDYLLYLCMFRPCFEIIY